MKEMGCTKALEQVMVLKLLKIKYTWMCLTAGNLRMKLNWGRWLNSMSLGLILWLESTCWRRTIKASQALVSGTRSSARDMQPKYHSSASFREWPGCPSSPKQPSSHHRLILSWIIDRASSLMVRTLGFSFWILPITEGVPWPFLSLWVPLWYHQGGTSSLCILFWFYEEVCFWSGSLEGCAGLRRCS